MTTVLVLPENDLIWKIMQGLQGFIVTEPFLIFWIFMKKTI